MAAKALSNQMTRTVRVNREKLIETLKENRREHVLQFNEAMLGYKQVARTKVIEAFQGLSSKLEKRKEELLKHVDSFTAETARTFDDHFLILQSVAVNMEVPVSYEEAYDAAIDMAEFDTRDELDLSGAEFQCFCRDVWDWTHEFTRTSMSYTGNK